MKIAGNRQKQTLDIGRHFGACIFAVGLSLSFLLYAINILLTLCGILHTAHLKTITTKKTFKKWTV